MTLCSALLLAWTLAAPGHAWRFPQDHWAHRDYRTEWWYLTGDLQAADGRRFGYQFTVFRVGIVPERPEVGSAWAAGTLLMGHAALTDLQAGTHAFSDLLYREVPLLAGFGTYPDPLLAWSRAPAGTDGLWTLRWNGEGFDLSMRDDARGFALALTTRAAKPVVLQGPGGLSLKAAAPGHASLYYSLTRLETVGLVETGGRSHAVRGTSWMDKEFSSSQLAQGQVGWDWFALRLDDGRDLMLYALRRADGTADFRNATLVAPDGTARWLAPGEWSLRSTGTWTSPATGTAWPSRWEVEVPGEGLALRVVPELADQENVSRIPAAPTYWEGLVRVEDGAGRTAGRGYVELTGYGTGGRPPV